MICSNRLDARLPLLVSLQFVATYTRGADTLLGGAPRAVNRVFGGLMWVIALATCAGYVSASHVAEYNTSNGGIWNLLLLLVCGGNLVRSVPQPGCAGCQG